MFYADEVIYLKTQESILLPYLAVLASVATKVAILTEAEHLIFDLIWFASVQNFRAYLILVPMK